MKQLLKELQLILTTYLLKSQSFHKDLHLVHPRMKTQMLKINRQRNSKTKNN